MLKIMTRAPRLMASPKHGGADYPYVHNNKKLIRSGGTQSGTAALIASGGRGASAPINPF
jgi:hypothetical protein